MSRHLKEFKGDLKEQSNFQLKYCRLCCKDIRHGVSIFGEEGKRLKIPDKIRKIVQVLVLQEDQLPKRICTDCCTNLELFSNFKDTVLDTQDKLSTIAKSIEKNQQQQQLSSSTSSLSLSIVSVPPERHRDYDESSPSPSPVAGYLLDDNDNDGYDADNLLEDNTPPPLSSPVPAPAAPSLNQSQPKLSLSPNKSPVKSSSSSHKSLIKSPIKSSKESQSQGVVTVTSNEKVTSPSPSPSDEKPTSTTTKSTWFCNICNKTLYSSTGFHNHMMTHSGRRFSCDEPSCNAIYTQKAALDVHKKIHHLKTPKNFICPISTCSKKFIGLKQLNVHKKVHADPSPEFSCHVCKKLFRTIRLLNVHMKYHSVNKRFACTYCSKSFVVKSKLNEHINAHTGLKPFGCPFELCPKRFNSRPNYVKHCRRKHINEVRENSNKCPAPKILQSQSQEKGLEQNNNNTTNPNVQQQEQPSTSSACHSSSIQQNESIQTIIHHDSHFWNQNDDKNHTQHQAATSSNNSVNSIQVNALDLVDTEIQNALVHSNDNNIIEKHYQIQSKPMELSYKDHNQQQQQQQQHCSTAAVITSSNNEFQQNNCNNNNFQDMPMELTKVFQRDPLELCVRNEFVPLIDLRIGVNGSGNLNGNSNGNGNCIQDQGSSNMGMGSCQKLDMTESFMDLSGAFRLPIDLISRTDDGNHELCTDGNLVDLSLRSGFGQDHTTSSFLRELIDLSARSEAFHGADFTRELDLTKHPNHQSNNIHIQHSNSNSINSTQNQSSSQSHVNTNTTISSNFNIMQHQHQISHNNNNGIMIRHPQTSAPASTTTTNTIQNVIYHDMFNLQ